jgi:hypothetical protein
MDVGKGCEMERICFLTFLLQLFVQRPIWAGQCVILIVFVILRSLHHRRQLHSFYLEHFACRALVHRVMAFVLLSLNLISQG